LPLGVGQIQQKPEEKEKILKELIELYVFGKT
jgi:hypothetical protein